MVYPGAFSFGSPFQMMKRGAVVPGWEILFL